MKKTYTMPEMEITKLQQANIIATSPTIKDDNIDPSLPNLGGFRDVDEDEF